MSSSTPIIITVPTKPPTQESAARSETQESIYDAARAIIAEAELNSQPIWFRSDDESPLD